MRYLKKLNIKEWVTIVYFAWLVAICIIFRENRPNWPVFVVAHSAAIGLIIWLANQAWFSQGFWRGVRDLYPYLTAISGYGESGNFVRIIITDRWFDDVLIAFDYALFNLHPTVWLAEHGNMLLNEYANFAYFSYFAYVPVLVYHVWQRRPSHAYEGFMGGLTMSYNFCFIFFALVPAASPRFALPDMGLITQESVRLPGYVFTWLIDFCMDNAAMRGGAFPSVHCCASTVFLLNTYRYCSRKTFMFSLILVVGMYWSTVYGRYHYVADVLAGIGLGVLFTWAGYYLQKRIESYRELQDCSSIPKE